MKKTIYLLFLTFALFGCETESEVITEELNQKQIEAVFKFTGQAQRNAFVLLEPSTKYKIWSDKLGRDKQYLNDEQIEIVDDLLQIINPEFFGITDVLNSEYEIELNEWMKKAKLVFEKEQYIDTFVSLKSPSEEVNSSNFEPEPEPPFIDDGLIKDELPIGGGISCECNTTHDLCVWDRCVKSTCDKSTYGCGLVWMYPCNGRC